MACKGCFSGAQIAVQIDRQTRLQHARQRRAEGVGAGFVVQFVGMVIGRLGHGWSVWMNLYAEFTGVK